MFKLPIKILIVVFILFGMRCRNTEPLPTDPIDQLPPATQTGENTFGCLFNGQAFLVTSSANATATYQAGILLLGGTIYNVDHTEQVVIWLEQTITTRKYDLNESFLNIGFYRNFIQDCEYQTFNPSSGSVVISKIDQINFIVSGTFQFDAMSVDCQDTIQITDGRFDMQYTP